MWQVIGAEDECPVSSDRADLGPIRERGLSGQTEMPAARAFAFISWELRA